jgi:hypothetical protein
MSFSFLYVNSTYCGYPGYHEIGYKEVAIDQKVS